MLKHTLLAITLLLSVNAKFNLIHHATGVLDDLQFYEGTVDDIF